MGILSLSTTINPYNGQELSSPVEFSYDTDKINFASLAPQTDPSKSKFLYRIQESIPSFPFETGQFSWAYVNATVQDVLDGLNPASGPEVSWIVPSTEQIRYFTASGGATYSETTLGSVPDSLWTVANIDKGTATNATVVFTPSVSAEATKAYRVNRGSPNPLSGVITMDAVATVDGASTTVPLTFVIRPLNNFSPSGLISDTVGPAGSWFWTVTTNIPCSIDFVDQNDGGTGISFQILPISSTQYYIGGGSPTATGQATFKYQLTSDANPLCLIVSTSTFTIDCVV